MTEAEWLVDTSLKLLDHLRRFPDFSERKFRLFGVACCRRVEGQIPDLELAKVIEECEQLTDEASDNDLKLRQLLLLNRTAERVAIRSDVEDDPEHDAFARAVIQLVTYPFYPVDCADLCMQALCGHDDYVSGQGEMLFQADLLRDICGNPFRSVIFAPEWRTDTATAIARQMYESRDFGAMPILADALQDAGCDNEHILHHCRNEGFHVRGCWVVDLVLGKA